MSEPVVFRGLRGRTLDDQADALSQGYNSMTEYAIDELGRIVLELKQQVERIEADLDEILGRRVDTDNTPCQWGT